MKKTSAVSLPTLPVVELVGQGSSPNILNLLEALDARFGADPVRVRYELMLEALRAAVSDLTKRLGADQTQWQWGVLRDRFGREGRGAPARRRFSVFKKSSRRPSRVIIFA